MGKEDKAVLSHSEGEESDSENEFLEENERILGEDEPTKKRELINNQELMKIRLEELKKEIDWIERMDVTVDLSDLPGLNPTEETEKKTNGTKEEVVDENIQPDNTNDDHQGNFETLTDSGENVHEELKFTTSDSVCESCGKSFSNTSNLKKHIRKVHEGHRAYKCESCGKSFFQKGDLKRHIHTVHEGHRDFKCESCGKSFSIAQGLSLHISTIHGGEGDYKCQICDKSFTQSIYLKQHLVRYHEVNEFYKCEPCGKSF